MGKCKNCVNHGTVNCPESYREPTIDDTCDSFVDDGSLQGIKEFAEWLENNGYLNWIGEGNDVNSISAKEVLAEWQEETR